MENLYIIGIAFICAVVMGRIIVPNVLVISLRKRLFDKPDARKIHKRPVPRLGGVAFFPIILFTMCLSVGVRLLYGWEMIESEMYEFLFLVSGITLLYIVGIADDLVGVRYRKKFLVQILATLMFPLAGLYVNSFYGLFGIYYVSPSWGIPLTILLVVFITNAINLIDGIDGLASGLSIVALVVFGLLFIDCREWVYSLLAFVSVGVIIPFFSYNVFGSAERGRKIFMGDTGSLTLGFILSFCVIRYSMYDPSHRYMPMCSPVLVSFSVLLVPCLDVVRVVMRRARNRKPLFLPDKSHIHHKFLDMGFSPHWAMITILLISACFCAFTVISIRYMNNTLVFVIDVLVWTVLHLWFDWIIKKRKEKAGKTPI